MGLAGPKRRTKLSADPNNTNWTRNSSSFGHRILTQQGWTPGAYLGAVDAAHASHYTAANASHVRVLLKDDNLGLGASLKREGAETFGLDQFSGLLGRLNGKDSTVLKKEEQSRRDVKLRLYQEGKFGGVRFVSAGFLVGDEVKELKRSEVERRVAAEKLQEATEPERGKKREANGDVKEQNTESSKATQSCPPSQIHNTPVLEDEKAAKRRRKEERRQKRAEKAQRREQRTAEALSKAERRQRKLDRRRDEEKEKLGALADDSTSSQNLSHSVQRTNEAILGSGDDSSSASPVPTFLPRNSVRQRYIRQKRMAGLDPKALREIFMIKSSV